MKGPTIFAAWVLALFVSLAISSVSAQTTGGFTTLYARDPLAQSLCLRDGGYGTVIQDHELRNRCSDLNFNSYKPDALTVGIEGGREGVIVDLGSPAELQKKYGYRETVGHGQGYASLQRKEGKLHILQNAFTRTTQELQGIEPLFQKPAAETKTASIKPGNIYLIRLTDSYDKSFERLAKLIVVAHSPGESVTIRWQLL
jgi:hypothetical protein